MDHYPWPAGTLLSRENRDLNVGRFGPVRRARDQNLRPGADVSFGIGSVNASGDSQKGSFGQPR